MPVPFIFFLFPRAGEKNIYLYVEDDVYLVGDPLTKHRTYMRELFSTNQKVTGSNPVGRAKNLETNVSRFFIILICNKRTVFTAA